MAPMNKAAGHIVHLDRSGRLLIPSSLLPPSTARRGLIFTPGFERSVCVFTAERWDRLLDALATLPIGTFQARMFERLLVGGAVAVAPDRAGRLRLPATLRQWAGLDSRLLALPVGQRLELWAPERWAALRGPALARYQQLTRAFFTLLRPRDPAVAMKGGSHVP